ncbi:hypothetical protein B4153_5954 [Bacillus cereus]|uniref:Uncharacterized protein n=1 Tax=Bacillus cereus (strain AH187) TaxID=405534 RepID=B7I0P9_BACC7|nr:hypothetical protein BCAH187_D0018 [Bacillus cereus AH187]KLA03404.1 hypothetical protein B4153_5954 [Bacillus cereus]
MILKVMLLLLFPFITFVALNRIMLFMSAYKISKFKRVNLDG